MLQGGTSKKSLEIPNAVEKAISELAEQQGMAICMLRAVTSQGGYALDLTLMIMGQANTGKSTLARYAVNSLLNQ